MAGAYELKDNSAQLFGRAKDLAKLHARAARPGVTAVIGPAQMGKSWLLMELARQLAESPSPRRVVGFSSSPKTYDPLLLVVADLYQRWLADAKAWEAARMVAVQQKDRALPGLTRSLSRVVEKILKLIPVYGEIAGTAIHEAVEGLVVASEDLRTGPPNIPRLGYTRPRNWWVPS